MVLKLAHSWRAAAGAANEDEAEQGLDYDDPVAILIRERKAEKKKREEQEVVTERHLQQRHAAEQEQQEDEDRRLREWFASPEYRLALNTLSEQVDDARTATARARERAAIEQQQTREALEKARRDALVVDGNRRVYFTRDGSRLYGEDDRQITNAGTIAEAQRQQRDKPDATTYEDYTDKKRAHCQADKSMEELQKATTRLDDLDKRIKKGDLSPEDLAQARRDQQEIIDGLRPESRAEYARLQAARQSGHDAAYRPVDPAFASAPNVGSDFKQAVTAPLAPGQGSQPQEERRPPAYKAAPDY